MARSAPARKAPPAVPPPVDPAELLETPLAKSGLAAGAQLRRAGIRLDFYTVRDLLFHLPRRYDDLREMRLIRDLYMEQDGAVVSVQATVGDVRVEPGFRGRIQRTIARLEDDTGSVDATWFGRRFIERRLPVGGEVVVSGKIKHFGRRLTLDNPEFQVLTGETEVLHAGRIVPVYPLTAGLPAARLRSAIREALDKAGHAYPEYLPASILAEERLVPIARAIEEAHYPETFEGRDAALERLAFDELLALQLGMVQRRRQRVRDAAPIVTLDADLDEAVRTALVDAIGAQGGATDRADRGPGLGDGRDPRGPGATDADAPPPAGRRRARARPRWPRTRWPPRLGQDSRGPSWRRPICSRGSTSRRSAPCSTGSGSA